MRCLEFNGLSEAQEANRKPDRTNKPEDFHRRRVCIKQVAALARIEIKEFR